MEYKISYEDGVTGHQKTVTKNSRVEAETQTKELADLHGCKATCESNDGIVVKEILSAVPGKLTHIITA